MKRILPALLICLMMISCSLSLAESWDEAANLYQPVLDRYIRGFAGNEEIFMQDESVETAYRCALLAGTDPMLAVGYTYADLDGDGVPELLIGETGDVNLLDGCLFDILALEGGKPVSVIRGWERNRLYLTYDQALSRYGYYREGSSGASNSVFEYGLAGDGMRGWEDQHTIEANQNFDTNRLVWTLDGEEIPEDEAERMIEKWQSTKYHPYLLSFFEHVSQDQRMGFSDDATPQAENAYCRSFQVSEDGPILDLMIADTGIEAEEENALREHLLRVTVTARDGGFSQAFQYNASDTPDVITGKSMALFDDMNFDGYRDLVLITARGAYNEYVVFRLWNPAENRFGDIVTHSPWNSAQERFDTGAQPLELCNYQRRKTDADPGRILSMEKDGYAEQTTSVYQWQPGGESLHCAYIFDVYETDDGLIGDRMFEIFTQVSKVWDHAYPLAWYYGEAQGYLDRADAAEAYMEGEKTVRYVANTDWVNLREMDSLSSPSLAHLDQGTEVWALKENCGDGQQWTLALWNNQIGYIRKEFLSSP